MRFSSHFCLKTRMDTAESLSALEGARADEAA
jgi:hypothetical protein